MSEPMMSGPCIVCGRRGYLRSKGGPSVCPACDVGATSDPKNYERLRQDYIALRTDVDQRVAEAERAALVAHFEAIGLAVTEPLETCLAAVIRRMGEAEREVERLRADALRHKGVN